MKKLKKIYIHSTCSKFKELVGGVIREELKGDYSITTEPADADKAIYLVHRPSELNFTELVKLVEVLPSNTPIIFARNYREYTIHDRNFNEFLVGIGFELRGLPTDLEGQVSYYVFNFPITYKDGGVLDLTGVDVEKQRKDFKDSIINALSYMV